MYQRLWSSVTEIFAAGGTQVLAFSQAAALKVRVRSDFPLLVAFGGSAAGDMVNTGPGAYELTWEQQGMRVTTVTLSFPSGFTAQADLFKRHGMVMIEGCSDYRDGFDSIEVHKLPHHVYLFTTATISRGTNPGWLKSLVAADWNIGTKRPEAVWISAISMSRERAIFPGLSTPASTICYEVQVTKQDVPAGDGTTLAISKGWGTCWQGIFNQPVKIPLRSIYTPWAAETPNIEVLCWGETDDVEDTFVAFGMNCYYLMR